MTQKLASNCHVLNPIFSRLKHRPPSNYIISVSILKFSGRLFFHCCIPWIYLLQTTAQMINWIPNVSCSRPLFHQQREKPWRQKNDYYLFTESFIWRTDEMVFSKMISLFSYFSLLVWAVNTQIVLLFCLVSFFLTCDYNKSKIVRLIIHFSHPIYSWTCTCLESDHFWIDMQISFFVIIHHTHTHTYIYSASLFSRFLLRCCKHKERPASFHYHVIHNIFINFLTMILIDIDCVCCQPCSQF